MAQDNASIIERAILDGMRATGARLEQWHWMIITPPLKTDAERAVIDAWLSRSKWSWCEQREIKGIDNRCISFLNTEAGHEWKADGRLAI